MSANRDDFGPRLTKAGEEDAQFKKHMIKTFMHEYSIYARGAMMNEEVKQVPSDLVVKATAKLQTDIDKELSVPDPEPGALARMYDKSDKKSKKKEDK
jgi:hypothetical protein